MLLLRPSQIQPQWGPNHGRMKLYTASIAQFRLSVLFVCHIFIFLSGITIGARHHSQLRNAPMDHFFTRFEPLTGRWLSFGF